jgi:hypothetical protein
MEELSTVEDLPKILTTIILWELSMVGDLGI